MAHFKKSLFDFTRDRTLGSSDYNCLLSRCLDHLAIQPPHIYLFEDWIFYLNLFQSTSLRQFFLFCRKVSWTYLGIILLTRRERGISNILFYTLISSYLNITNTFKCSGSQKIFFTSSWCFWSLQWDLNPQQLHITDPGHLPQSHHSG